MGVREHREERLSGYTAKFLTPIYSGGEMAIAHYSSGYTTIFLTSIYSSGEVARAPYAATGN